MPNVYSQPTAYNGTPQMHGHSIMPQHNMPQLYNIAPQHMHAYTPRYTAAAIPPYQMGKQHSAVIQQALLQQLQGQAGHMGAQDAHRPAVWHARSNHAKCIHSAPAWVGPTRLPSHAA